nr:hypothetical protein [Tanacetum cinerariifolium]
AEKLWICSRGTRKRLRRSFFETTKATKSNSVVACRQRATIMKELWIPLTVVKRSTRSDPVANNSFFKGFFEKQKLTEPNFMDCYRQLRIVLSIEDKLNYIEQPIPPASVAPAGQHVAPEILAAHNA